MSQIQCKCDNKTLKRLLPHCQIHKFLSLNNCHIPTHFPLKTKTKTMQNPKKKIMILPVCFKARALCSSRILAASFHFSVHSRVSSLSWASLTASFLAKLLLGSLESKSVVSEALSLSISLRSSRINFTFGSSLTVGLLIMFLARLA